MKKVNVIQHFAAIGACSNLFEGDDEITNHFGDIVKAISHELKKDMTACRRYLGLDEASTFLFTIIMSIQSGGDNDIHIHDIAGKFALSEIDVLAQNKSFETLIEGGYIENKYDFLGLNQCSLCICTNVFNAILQSRPLTEEMLEANRTRKKSKISDQYSFVATVAEIADRRGRDVFIRKEEMYSLVTSIETAQEAMVPFIKSLRKLSCDIRDRMFFYLVCNGFTEEYDHSVNVNDILGNIIESTLLKNHLMRMLKSGCHVLIREKLIEVKDGDFAEHMEVTLSEAGKDLFLGEDAELYQGKVAERDMILCKDLKEKHLFFSESFSRDIDHLTQTLQEDSLKMLRNRLEEKKLPKGIAILLYGAPGTGKTESVYQIARQTGRNIMHIDISSTKSCWFGESQKLIKGVFTRYRTACRKDRIAPILLFNEADAVFSKRKDSNASSVAQTENAIQNILLEEMENFDGILMATTNLADNLDAAFERRFLFKLRYEKPDVEVKSMIWKDKVPALDETTIREIASRYDFSGGEIDNIVRKITVSEIVSGEAPGRDELLRICDNERLSKAGHGHRIGF